MSGEPKPNEIMEAVTELRGLVESKNADSAEAIGKIANIEEFLEKQETKNQELVKTLETKETAALEAKERLDSLEAKFLRMPAGDGPNAKQMEEMKSFESFIVKGGAQLSVEERKYLRTDVNTDGGFLAPNEYVREIIKQVTEISPIRSIARIRQTSSKAIEIPTRTGLVSGGWTGEGESGSDSNSNYGLLEIPVNKQTAIVPVTVEMLADAAFNVETEVNQDVSDFFAQHEGTAFVVGDAVKKPEGFMAASGIQVVNSGVADQITADSLIEITGELKDGYQGVYVMNRRTLATIRTLKDGQGQYLWQNGSLAAGLPASINGDRYVSAIDMADIAAGALPVAYGDFRRGYTIVDNIMMSIVRDAFTLAGDGKVRLVFHRRVGGQVVQPEALKHLKIAV